MRPSSSARYSSTGMAGAAWRAAMSRNSRRCSVIRVQQSNLPSGSQGEAARTARDTRAYGPVPTEVPIMTRGIIAAGALACVLAVSVMPAGAQVPDHLKCQDVKDGSGKREFSADLGGLALEPGCVVKLPAKLLCEQATTANE